MVAIGGKVCSGEGNLVEVGGGRLVVMPVIYGGVEARIVVA